MEHVMGNEVSGLQFF